MAATRMLPTTVPALIAPVTMPSDSPLFPSLATVEAVDVVCLDEEVVERRAEAANTDAPHENAREEGTRPGSWTAYGLI